VHGTFLHGEWFLEGQRCPGGDHRVPLPEDGSLTERPLAPADFPEMRQRLDVFDSCPNQFAYGDNFYQIAVWRAKTAAWAKHRLADECAAAAAASSEASSSAAAAAAAAASATARAYEVWSAAATRATPNAAFHVRAASTTHRLAAAVATHTSKLATSATTTSASASTFSASTVLSAEAAAATARSAASSHRLAAAAAKAADAAVAASPSSSEQAALASSAAACSAALASALAAASAANAASEAVAPPVEVQGLPTSPAAAAAIAAAPALNGIVRLAMKLVEHHGKGPCDGNSNTPVLAIKHAIQHKLMGPNPGTQQLEHFLAHHKPYTTTPKSEKRGWEAIGRIFYGFMNTDLFTKTVVADADGSKFTHSTKHHSFVGRHSSAQVLEKGEMQACHEFCPCSECLLGRYNACTLKSEMGSMHHVKVLGRRSRLLLPSLTFSRLLSPSLAFSRLLSLSLSPA
jgi:hypothetical protein